jgi:hypothetical protein
MEVRPMQFAFLLYGDEAAEAALTGEERRAIVEGHIEFSRALRERDQLRFGEALAPSDQAAVVRPRRRRVTDGPFAETKEQLGGLYIVECADRDEALELARQIPNSPGIAIEVRPIQ